MKGRPAHRWFGRSGRTRRPVVGGCELLIVDCGWPGRCGRRPSRRRLVLVPVALFLLLVFVLFFFDDVEAVVDFFVQLVVIVVVDAAGSEHEPVHAHAQVFAVRLEALPDKHAGPVLPGDLTTPGRDRISI